MLVITLETIKNIVLEYDLDKYSKNIRKIDINKFNKNNGYIEWINLIEKAVDDNRVLYTKDFSIFKPIKLAMMLYSYIMYHMSTYFSIKKFVEKYKNANLKRLSENNKRLLIFFSWCRKW